MKSQTRSLDHVLPFAEHRATLYGKPMVIFKHPNGDYDFVDVAYWNANRLPDFTFVLTVAP